MAAEHHPAPPPREPRGPDPFIRSQEHWTTQIFIPLSYALIGVAIGLIVLAAALAT